jgi:hypothetical protein
MPANELMLLVTTRNRPLDCVAISASHMVKNYRRLCHRFVHLTTPTG